MGTFDQEIAIRHVASNGHIATLSMGTIAFPCIIGPAGITHSKFEGDGATPAGRWPMRFVMYRADRVARPVTALPVKKIRPDSGWCDDPASRNYNKPVQLPYAHSHEKLWRKDHVYDIIVVLGHNDSPAVPGKGSAVFMHLSRPDRSATEGCIALRQNHLRQVLLRSGVATVLRIG
jgi:L,D-peptidoglycan transpeptidase YkuD (ErfK/YbiS/YcfS/YnhG family)